MIQTPLIFLDVFRVYGDTIKRIGVDLSIPEAARLMQISKADFTEEIVKEHKIRTEHYIAVIHGEALSHQLLQLEQR